VTIGGVGMAARTSVESLGRWRCCRITAGGTDSGSRATPGSARELAYAFGAAKLVEDGQLIVVIGFGGEDD